MNDMARRSAAIILLVSACAASSACATGATARPAASPAPAGPSLYERLGGVNAIAVVIDDVVDRSYADPVFHANPRIAEAHARYARAAYKYHATELACMAMGGPCKYTGRSVKDAHQRLQITEPEWVELIKVFRDSMTSFKVPAKEQGEVIAILEAAKGDVVAPPQASAAR